MKFTRQVTLTVWLLLNHRRNNLTIVFSIYLQEDWRKTDELVEENTKWTCFQAVLRLLFGMVIVALLSEPLVGAVHNFSRAVNIPPFYVSFIVVPLATNAREAFSAIGSARRKNQRTCSLTYSEVCFPLTFNTFHFDIRKEWCS